PEILGLAGHYARLHLLDPNRFHSYESFINETMSYRPITNLANKLIAEKKLTKDDYKTLKDKLGIDLETMDNKEALQALVDRHGTGRVYFRNTRQKMATYSEFFPKREFHPHKLSLGKSKNTESNVLDLKA